MSNNLIYIYRDEDCASPSYLKEWLEQFFPNHNIQYITSEDIKKNVLFNNKPQAVFFGGGQAGTYRKNLGMIGREKMREYISSGGNYFGLCAGAYLVAKKTIFVKEDNSRIIATEADGQLGLYDGLMVGFEEDYINNSKDIKFEGNQINVFHKQGPYMEVKDNCEVLASFSDSDRPAVIKTSFGKGKVILSAVHPEYPAEKLKTLGVENLNQEEINAFSAHILKDLKQPNVEIKKDFSNVPVLAST